MTPPDRREAHCHAEPAWPYSGRGHRDPQPGAPAIELSELQVRYERSTHPAVRGVSLVLQCGERAALVGPNGAGKSSILKSIAGLVAPKSGSIRLFGNRVGACHHQTAYFPQRTELDWQFPISVADLVMTGRYVHLGWFRRPGKEDRRRVQAALDRLGIAGLAHRQIGELSGGQQQRVLLSRALVQEARMFLLDEPLNAVDEATRDAVEDVLSDHAHGGGAVLAATHDLGRLTESFDVAIYLRAGRIERTHRMDGRCISSVTRTELDSRESTAACPG